MSLHEAAYVQTLVCLGSYSNGHSSNRSHRAYESDINISYFSVS